MEPSPSDVFMQVDENRANTSTPTKLGSVSPATLSGICVSDDTLQELSRELKPSILIIQTSDDGARLHRSLDFVWIAVNHAVAGDPKMPPLANLEEFRRNVEQKGEQQFINLLRDMAEENSWGELLANGTSFLSFVLDRSDHLLSPDVFLKENPENPDQSQESISQSSAEGAQ